MPTIASLKVLLTSRTAAFNRGMNRAATRVAAFGRTARAAGRGVRILSRSLLTLGLGGAGIGYIGRQALTTLDNLAKTADKLGATTEGLAALRVAARRSGVEARTFDMALQRLVRRAGTVAAGADSMGKSARMQARFFKALGLDAKALAALPADEAFRKWAAALDRITPRSKQVALAFKFVDSEGVGVVNMVKALVHEWDALYKRVQSMGLIFSRMELAQIEAAVNATGDLVDKLRGITFQAVLKLAPIITEAANRLFDMLGPAPQAAERLVGWIARMGKTVLAGIDLIKPGLALVANLLGVILEIGLRLGRWAMNLVGAELPKGIDTLIDALRRANNTLFDLWTTVGRGETWHDRVVGFFEDVAAKASRAAELAIGAPIGRIAEDAEEQLERIRATAQQLRPAAIGGFGGGAARWWGGQIESGIPARQLSVLETIRDTLRRIEDDDAGLGQ